MSSEIVKKIREHIEKNDRLVDLLGIKILEASEGYAKVELEVDDRHMNAAEVCHGGVIFSLADLALAIASNSHGKISLAIETSISYLKSVSKGEKIYAEAEEIHLGNRTATYLMTVRNSKNEIVAIAKGTVFRMENKFLSS